MVFGTHKGPKKSLNNELLGPLGLEDTLLQGLGGSLRSVILGDPPMGRRWLKAVG